MLDILTLLACPRDKTPLEKNGDLWQCESGHHYREIGGIPILLVPEGRKGYWGLKDTKEVVATDEEVDLYVQQVVAATCGNFYKKLIGKLPQYPIPQIPLPHSQGALFLELGCNWGRWCVAASRIGYTAFGVDPCIEAVLAAKKVANQLGVKATFICADARYLPFREGVFDQVFSYSVLQHFDRESFFMALTESDRVLKPSGQSLIQMPNRFGALNLFHMIRRGLRKAKEFEVRYWTPRQLKRFFSIKIGPTKMEVDGFFSLNPYLPEGAVLPFRYQLVIKLSNILKNSSAQVRWLRYFADSLFLSSRKGASLE